MSKSFAEDEVYSLVKSLTDRLGIEILEINTFRKRDQGRVRVVLCGQGDFGVDKLCDLHKMILLSLGSALKCKFSLELSTPGVNRKIKSKREFKIFEGKEIKLMLDNEFEEGLILKAEEDSFIFKTGSKEMKVFYGDVRKARLL
ncbi:ribosome maturation factor RimP [Borrelia sp. BU AG58]|uniref:ribosome maturation factor RimP n=1 Tax=Borrelia sp. BU AG58 TaxID=2887345 RepID=UPI001E4BC78E|nr:ribosome maturation factor RimP [Borrelia sp. BU AG58]UER67942.1 ribosome maturation factor RimP [Borrelia sp. BU AG58]